MSGRLSPASRCRRFACAALALIAASAAVAGPIDPNHVLQDLRTTVPAATAILKVPGSSRILVGDVQGSLRLVTGGGLAGEVVAQLGSDAACPAHGVRGLAWDPLAPGRAVFVSYVAADATLNVAQVDLASGAVTPVHRILGAAPCSDVGGGIAFAPDGTLLLGVGDYGVASRAGQSTLMMGKILRMTRDGAVPAAPLALNPLPTSRMYAMGVRDPVALFTDAAGATWFVDVGPARNDELNQVGSGSHYGWDSAMQSGFLEIPSRQDPWFVWAASITPTAILSQQDDGLGRALRGQVVVASASGRVSAIQPVGTTAGQSVETLLFQPDATGPQSFTALAALPAGALGLADGGGSLMRLASRVGIPHEPSSLEQVVPLTLRRSGPGTYDLGVENVPSATEVGIHRGDVLALLTTGYTHQLSPPSWLPLAGPPEDAIAHVTLTDADLGGAGSVAYVLASARRDCLETSVGQGTSGERPRAPSSCSVAVLGGGTHDIADVVVTEIATSADGLMLPRDLAFQPQVPGELWIVSRTDHSVVIVQDTNLPSQLTSKRVENNSGQHFMAQPAALAFGDGTGSFATAHEEDDYTQGPPPSGTPQDFMGPTLWTASSAIFEGGDISHLDMLHNSPNAMGIAWEQANVYWVFDGFHSSLTRYDFGDDHGLGGTDHADGICTRYAEGQVVRVPDVPSHVIHDPASGLVFACDTGNNRIVALDPSTGTNGGSTSPNYDGGMQNKVNGAVLTTLVDGVDVGMVAPSGLELHDDLLFVSDNATSRVMAFALDGTLVDWLDTGYPPGTLMGMAFDPRDGSLYVVDAINYRVLRIAPR